MLILWTLFATALAHSCAGTSPLVKRSFDKFNYYVLEYDPHNSSGASLVDVTRLLGVEVMESAGELKNHWIVRAEKPRNSVVARGSESDRVLDNLAVLRARANSHTLIRSEEDHRARSVVSSVRYLSRQTLRQRIKRAPPPILPSSSSSSREIAERLGIEDPLFSQQWHLVNDESPENMMNVVPVWEMGFTGKGIISSFVDDGLDYEHEDLADNFDADDSHDFNDHVDLPTPKNFDDHHGTRCAGQVAAAKNTVCGMGIAYDSKVAGVRILSGPISDVDEAAALNFGFHNVSIYSCSWGPPDNGQSMEGPGYLIKKAVVNGINDGRGGKGSIFVFASGNGAAHGDQCNFDGYTNSIYSVTVSAVDYKGLHPYYSEPCAANMVVAYSSGSGQHIVTTDKGKGQCATTHGGTSAAAPNAVGVFALALQARPELTWRDIQYLCIETARVVSPDDPDWERIANGKLYSYKYGYGALDGHKYVTAAQTWKLVKPQAWIITKTVQVDGGTMDESNVFSGGRFIGPQGITSTMTITAEMLAEYNFESLEHINVKVWINHTRRGDVEVEIISPRGFKSILASKRPADAANSGFPGWTFMSVKHWGENPVGEWTIKVSDQNTPDQTNGSFHGWNMIFWGSTIDPSKAQKFEVLQDDDSLPPKEAPPRPVIPTPTSTTKYARPTEHLPDDHGEKPGENSNPAFTTLNSDSPAATGNIPISPTPDEGWFPGMSNLVSHPKWVFGAVGAVVLFGAGVGIFFWRRRITRRRMMAYSVLENNDNISMSGLGEGQVARGSGNTRTTRELYDAFGEVSDDEDADESTGLRRSEGLGFHSAFLDDDEALPSETPITPRYRDHPEPSRIGDQPASGNGAESPIGSGDGSWDRASRDSGR